jgi:hypothetical protein
VLIHVVSVNIIISEKVVHGHIQRAHIQVVIVVHLVVEVIQHVIIIIIIAVNAVLVECSIQKVVMGSEVAHVRWLMMVLLLHGGRVVTLAVLTVRGVIALIVLIVEVVASACVCEGSGSCATAWL